MNMEYKNKMQSTKVLNILIHQNALQTMHFPFFSFAQKEHNFIKFA